MSYNGDLSSISGQMTGDLPKPIELSPVGCEVSSWLKEYQDAYACLNMSNASVRVALEDMHIDGYIIGASKDCVLVSDENTKKVYFVPTTSIKYIHISSIPGVK